MAGRLHFCLVLTCLLVVAGCGGTVSDEEKLTGMLGAAPSEVVPTGGAVTVDGGPAEGVCVLLHKADLKLPLEEVPVVKTDAEGKFSFTTYKAADGLPPGDYVLTFLWQHHRIAKGNKFSGDDKLNGRYSDPQKSGIALKVVSGVPQQELKFELTSK